MNILIIGLGSIARKHIAALDKIDASFNYFALRSSRNNADITGVKNLCSWDEVPSDISFAIIANPTNQHTTAIGQCVERNIPLFIEKPVSHQLAGLTELSEKIHDKNLKTYVACNLRFLPVLVFLKEQIRYKKINEVTVYCGSSLPSWRPGIDYKTSYSADEKRGGGVHLDLFHELDYLCWMLGKPMSSRGIIRKVSSLGINAADSANYLLFYKNFTASVILNYYRPDPKRTIEIVFYDTIWTIDLLKNNITDSSGKVIFEDIVHSVKDTYLLQMQYFIDHLKGKRGIDNNFDSSLEILKIALLNEKID